MADNKDIYFVVGLSPDNDPTIILQSNKTLEGKTNLALIS